MTNSVRAAGSIRPARPEDEQPLRALQSLLPEPSPGLLTVAISSGTVLVSTEADRPVGYLLPLYGDGAHVAELAVAATHRREGRATALLGALAALLPDGERITLLVERENRAARACYEAAGFRERARRPDAFESGEGVLYEYRV